MKPKPHPTKRAQQYRVNTHQATTTTTNSHYGNMDAFETLWRKEFVQDLPGNFKNMVRGVDISLINDAIAAIRNGNATINNKAPVTRAERFIVIATYFKMAKTLLHIQFEGARNVEKNCIVAIKCNDKGHLVTFPENIIGN